MAIITWLCRVPRRPVKAKQCGEVGGGLSLPPSPRKAVLVGMPIHQPGRTVRNHSVTSGKMEKQPSDHSKLLGLALNRSRNGSGCVPSAGRMGLVQKEMGQAVRALYKYLNGNRAAHGGYSPGV